MNALTVTNVTKQYKDFTLGPIGFSLPQGSIMGLIGENGAGKTTTIKLILNMVGRKQGEIAVFGLDNRKDEVAAKRLIGTVLDENYFPEPLKTPELAKIMRGVWENWDDALFADHLKKFSLPQEKKIKEYSRGMKMKLSLAVALSHHPKLLILDEATSGLDPVVRSEILDVFLDFIQDETHAVLLSSHITGDLEKIADYITFLHEGKIVLSESKDELLYRYGVMKCGAEAFSKIRPDDVVSYRRTGFGYEALTRDRQAAARKYQDVVIDGVTLDEIMLFYAKGERR